jgi:uncharacterized protein
MGQVAVFRELPFLERLVQTLARGSKVKLILLFGSRARGDHQERSDIDLAVECPDASVQEWQAVLDIIEEAPTLLPIDCVCLETASEDLKRSILKWVGDSIVCQNGAGL